MRLEEAIETLDAQAMSVMHSFVSKGEFALFVRTNCADKGDSAIMVLSQKPDRETAEAIIEAVTMALES